MLAPYSNETKTLSPAFKLFNSSKTILELEVVLIGMFTHPGFKRGIRQIIQLKEK